jgi:beta-glucosidase
MPKGGHCALAGVLLLGLVAPGHAASVAQRARRCEAAVAGGGKRLFAASLAALAGCEQRLARGALPAGTDCQTEAGATAHRALAATRWADRIAATCPPDVAAALALGGDCTAARSPSALIACVEGNHAANATAVVGAAGAALDGVPAAARGCQATALRAAGAFALARLRLLQRCKRNPPPDLPPRVACADAADTAARIAAIRTRSATRIAARCQGAALSGAVFGVPCTAPASGDDLAQCLLATVDGAIDDTLATEFPDTGFCGDARAKVEERLDALLAGMTLTDKLAQMHGSGAAGGVWRTPADTANGLPGMGMIDGARGVGVMAGTATCFPVPMARGATWDPALEERVGDAIGVEARAKGASVILAPVLNNLRHPRWGRAQETYGEDTVLLGRMGVGFIRGAQAHVIANPKHFAANSIEDTRFSVNVAMDERTLREIYLPQFRMAVQEGHAASVMSAYNQVNGHYCAENAHLLHDVLTDDWGFQGFVESDWVLGTRSTVPSANAGLDIEMPSAHYFGAPLASAVAGGQVAESTIDAAVRRIARAQLCFRLDTDPPLPDPGQIETPTHVALALQVAREGIVLLKNDAAALPLDRGQVTSLAVVGPLAALANLGDHGSSRVIPASAVAPLDGITSHAGSVAVTYVASSSLSPADAATVAAADAVVVVAGLTDADEGEGLITHGDRDSLALPGTQDALIASVAALNARTIVVLEGSGALLMPWKDSVPAIVMAWYPGEQGGNAIAEVLFGDVNPSGKLPMTFPVAESDLPPFDNVSTAVTYDYYHGYRYLDRNAVAPLFPFGFGLSYTTFQYAHLTVTPQAPSPAGRVRVTADVTNTGTVAGDEIAQLYVGYEGSGVDRAVADLKGFARVHLEPGATRTVAFDVRAADLAYWDTAAAAWVVEPITYDVRVGPSSRDLPLHGTFTIAP